MNGERDWQDIEGQEESIRVLQKALAAGEAVLVPGGGREVVLTRVSAPEIPGLARSSGVLVVDPIRTDWLSALGPLARRILQRTGGQAIAKIKLSPDSMNYLAPSVRGLLGPQRELLATGIGHVVILEILDEPLLLWEVEATPPTVAVRVCDSQDSLQGPATRVEIRQSTWAITQPGQLSESEIKRAAARWVVFVCTGNTCRSPMAEALCKRLLASKLNCEIAELADRGFWVTSAGLAAGFGGAAALEAQETVAELGADLSEHCSRPVNPRLLTLADDILTMTRGHLELLNQYLPYLSSPARLLADDGRDILDPIGAGRAVYRECAETILAYLRPMLTEWVPE